MATMMAVLPLVVFQACGAWMRERVHCEPKCGSFGMVWFQIHILLDELDLEAFLETVEKCGGAGGFCKIHHLYIQVGDLGVLPGAKAAHHGCRLTGAAAIAETNHLAAGNGDLGAKQAQRPQKEGRNRKLRHVIFFSGSGSAKVFLSTPGFFPGFSDELALCPCRMT
jgi:hypothetical protein